MPDGAPPDYLARVAEAIGTTTTGPGYERYSGLYFFISLDLVNSTAYKSRNADWQLRIRMFYDEATNFWRNYDNHFHPRVWKYAGDEVLFYYKIRSVHDLEIAVQASYEALRVVSNTVQEWTADKIPRLYVKATCWIADAKYKTPNDVGQDVSTETRNIIFASPTGFGGGSTPLDFIGPEIDAGFRIATGSIKNSLVVSAELADLVWERGVRRTGDGLRLVDFRELKGVWDGRPYPLIWYRKSWAQSDLDADFDYDDPIRFDILAKAHSASPESVARLAKILDQVQRTWHRAIELPPEPSETTLDVEVVLAAPAMTEVHCVAMCFAADGKVLLAQRPANKTTYGGKWEGGYAQLKQGDDFQSAMRRDYELTFGIKISFDRFKSWGVIGSYSFEKHGVIVPGVVFVADVLNAEALKTIKHDDAQWYDPENLPADIVTSGVPELVERVKRAHEVWKATSAPATDSQTGS